jgi:hypothetical protein
MDYIERIMKRVEAIEGTSENEITQQQTEEWHQARLGKFTSSRFGDMMKTGRKKEEKFGGMAISYIYEKIAELWTGSWHAVTSISTEWGNDLEPEAILRYEKETKNTVTPVGFIPYGEWAGGSPDGLVGNDGIIEVKCPYNSANHVKTIILNEVWDDSHLFQMQGNLMVTNRKWCDYITYDPRMQDEALQFHVIRVIRDDEIIKIIDDRIKEIVEKMKEIMNEYKK